MYREGAAPTQLLNEPTSGDVIPITYSYLNSLYLLKSHWNLSVLFILSLTADLYLTSQAAT